MGPGEEAERVLEGRGLEMLKGGFPCRERGGFQGRRGGEGLKGNGEVGGGRKEGGKEGQRRGCCKEFERMWFEVGRGVKWFKRVMWFFFFERRVGQSVRE